jgi:hypothetical protein
MQHNCGTMNYNAVWGAPCKQACRPRRASRWFRAGRGRICTETKTMMRRTAHFSGDGNRSKQASANTRARMRWRHTDGLRHVDVWRHAAPTACGPDKRLAHACVAASPLRRKARFPCHCAPRHLLTPLHECGLPRRASMRVYVRSWELLQRARAHVIPSERRSDTE